MTNKTVTMPLELAESLLSWLLMQQHYRVSDVEQLRALLAAPAVERQEPIYQVRYLGDGGGGWIDVERDEFNSDNLGISNYQTRTLYTSPPAPVAVVLPSREAMRDIIAEAIGGDTYYCTRVWSAWGVGTMSEDDFVPITLDEERLYEIADACLDKVKELSK